MSLLGQVLWWYVDTLFYAVCRGCNILWLRYVGAQKEMKCFEI